MNSSVVLPPNFKRVGTARCVEQAMPEMLHLETFRATHSRERILENLRPSASPADIVNEYNYFHVTTVPSEERTRESERREKRSELIRELLSSDIENKRAEGEARLICSFESHYRFAVQVVFKPPRHHWDEQHVRELFLPLVQFDRDVSRLAFANRGGRFIVVYCPVLLQGLKAVQCLVSNIKRGVSYLFHDAAVIVDYFPRGVGELPASSLSSMQEGPILFRQSSDNRKTEPRTMRLIKMREKKRRLALKLLREQQVFPRGRNEIDQRIVILSQYSSSGVAANSTSIVKSNNATPLVNHHDHPTSLLTLAAPMTRLRPQSTRKKLLLDPNIEAELPRCDRGRSFLHDVVGDTITDFHSGAGSPGMASMRIDLSTVQSNVQLDESPRDYDLLGEHKYHLRSRIAREPYTVRNPPPAEIASHYCVSFESGVAYRKCALSNPYLFFVDGDSRLNRLHAQQCEALPQIDSPSKANLESRLRLKLRLAMDVAQ